MESSPIGCPTFNTRFTKEGTSQGKKIFSILVPLLTPR